MQPSNLYNPVDPDYDLRVAEADARADLKADNGMIETADGRHAVCVNKADRFYGWVFQKHPDGQWVSMRLALPSEMNSAILKKDWENRHEPQRG